MTFSVRALLDEDIEDGSLEVDATVHAYNEINAAGFIEIQLLDANNEQVLTASEQFATDGIVEDTIYFAEPVIDPELWSDEQPYLYTLLLVLKNENDEVLEVLRQPVGFRRLEIQNGQMLVNGMPVYIKGVNRHEHHPVYGRSIPREAMLRDITLMKQFNLNAVRTSHYPNDPEWFGLCDTLGIYVQDEVNAECHYSESWFSNLPDYQDAFLDRFVRMVERDKNATSVIMWSTGNECGLGDAHYAMNEFIEQRDPTRLMYHQSNWPNGEAPYVDVIGPRYPTPALPDEVWRKMIRDRW